MYGPGSMSRRRRKRLLVTITIAVERDGKFYDQRLDAKTGDRFEVGPDGVLVRVLNNCAIQKQENTHEHNRRSLQHRLRWNQNTSDHGCHRCRRHHTPVRCRLNGLAARTVADPDRTRADEPIDRSGSERRAVMRTCSTCRHWIENNKRRQRNAGVCNHRDRLVHLGDQVALPLMFGHESCDRHEQKRETEAEGAQS